MKKATANTYKMIPLARIKLNPMQPRKFFDKEELQELSGSIREHGVIQPISVEACEKDFILHDGERRFRAAQLAGLKRIPAVVSPPLNGTGPRERLERALVANVQRSEMHPIEEGLAYQRLMDEFGYSVQDVRKSTGKNLARIYFCLSLLELEPEIQQLMMQRKLPCGDHRILTSLKRIPTGQERIKLATALAERNATGNMIVLACTNYLIGKRRGSRTSKKGSPALTMIEGNHPEWDALYQLNKVPPWPVVTSAVMKTCDECPVRSIASDITCRDCGLVGALKLMLEMAHVK